VQEERTLHPEKEGEKFVDVNSPLCNKEKKVEGKLHTIRSGEKGEEKKKAKPPTISLFLGLCH